MIHTVLSTCDGRQRDYASQQGGFEPWQQMPCLRCGVCCTKWQPQVDIEVANNLARQLGMSLKRFLKEYAIKYPVKRNSYVFQRRQGACVFLKHEAEFATCAIHAFKPQACCDWMPSLSRRECQEGLRKRPSQANLMRPQELYVSPEELQAFCRMLKSQTEDDRPAS